MPGEVRQRCASPSAYPSPCWPPLPPPRLIGQAEREVRLTVVRAAAEEQPQAAANRSRTTQNYPQGIREQLMTARVPWGSKGGPNCFLKP